MRYSVSTVLLILTSTSLSGEESVLDHPRSGRSKPPWEWTLSERLKSRLDPNEIRRRAEAHRAELSQDSTERRTQSNASPKDFFIVDGSKNPELFLSYELMNALLRSVSSDAEMRESARRSYRRRIERFGWNVPEFWATIDRITAGYAAVIDAEAAIQVRLSEPQTPSRRERLLAEQRTLHRSICQRRAPILQAARAAFDPGEFERFLYTAIAPHLSVVSEVPENSEAAELQQREEGCR